MKFNYRFSNLCGVAHKGGNVLFTPDGNQLLSAVGNRVSVFDLVNHRARTMPFEARRDIKRMALSNSGRLLVVVDADGRALIVSFAAQTVLHRFNFKKHVKALAFSPDDGYLAVGVGRQIQVWRTPALHKEFTPMAHHRTYTGHNDTVTTITWSRDGRYFCTGSRDNTSRIYSLHPEKDFVVVTLTGHRDQIVGCAFQDKVALPVATETDIRVRDRDSGEGAADVLFAELLDPAPVIYTVSADGALIVWRWTWEKELKDSDEEDNDEDARPNRFAAGDERAPALSIHHGEWRRHARYFLQKGHANVQSVAMHPKRPDLLVVGFNNGVFSLFEMPTATHIQSLSVSQHELKTAAVNCTGEWIALASAKLGQVLVWEWQSETYVLKQQGHFYDLNVVAYSPDGQLIATGGDDAKVKLWNTTSGFCFVTFSEHNAPVTALAFIGEGNAVVSASLDGTVRAFDLVRYRNFRTMATPTPVQLTCLAVDGQGEVVCAGALDPPEIYVWSLQTGRLLDVLAGHTGPLSSLSFSPTGASLASTSWDQTMRVWEPYESTAPKETFSVGSDALCCAYRPDGKELCVGALNGHLQLWDVENGHLKGVIEGVRDISGGRRHTDRTSAQNATHNKHFSSVCYTADGKCVIAGGRSKFVCIYQVEQRILLKKYQLSHNRSLEGVLDKLNSREVTEAGPDALLDVSDGEDSDEDFAAKASMLPGAQRGDAAKRSVRPEIRCKSIQFSPTGQEWAAATTEGLMIYSLDAAMLFDPFQLDQDVTPDSIRELARDGNHGRALTYALHLGEQDLIVEMYRSVPTVAVKLVAQSLPVVYIERMLKVIASELSSTPQIEHHLSWALSLLGAQNDRLRAHAPQFLSAFRALQKAIAKHSKDLSRLCNDNMYALSFLASTSSGKADNGTSNGEGTPEVSKALFRLVRPAPAEDAQSAEKDAKRQKSA